MSNDIHDYRNYRKVSENSATLIQSFILFYGIPTCI